MEQAALAPANEASFDKQRNAAANESDPTSTSTMGVTGPPTNISAKTTTTTGTTSTTENSPGYLQQARETLASLAGTVQNAVGIDTPASTLREVANNTKIDASMPSSETSGAKPGEHSAGVGALPGGNTEEGVARVPDERNSIPSHEHEGARPGEKADGVGALPGSLNESGVALLPDERNAQTKEGVQDSTHTAVHPTSEHPDKTDIKTAAAHPIETAKQARRGSTSSSSSSEGEQEPGVPKKKKVSLKDKLKGDMKVAMGKVKKNEELIAEGQAQRGH